MCHPTYSQRITITPMTRAFFQKIEPCLQGTEFPQDEFLDQLAWTADGLIPVITQQHDSGEVLMMAWMNRESLALTLTTGWVTYWSRSRNQLWKKGESSGHLQRLIELRADCDGDTLLCLADQKGGACHTGRDNCFYFSFSPNEQVVRVNQTMPGVESEGESGDE